MLVEAEVGLDAFLGRDADLLAQLIYATRKRMKHRGISPTEVGSKEWGVLKEITAHALDFANEFNLQRRYGFLKYVEVALAKMKKFNLNKFLPMYHTKKDPHCQGSFWDQARQLACFVTLTNGVKYII